eukprot:2160491-Pyramimonas_sp.AAC.1
MHRVRGAAEDTQRESRHHLHPVLEESQVEEEVCPSVWSGDVGYIGGNGHGRAYAYHVARSPRQRVRPHEALLANRAISRGQ